jgi:hypothetical protein
MALFNSGGQVNQGVISQPAVLATNKLNSQGMNIIQIGKLAKLKC